ncbi:MAG TPA: transcription antitermination factor NusB [Candidatus Eisenbacteria bacterium]
MNGPRRRSRIAAMRALFQMQVVEDPIEPVVAAMRSDAELSEDIASYGAHLVTLFHLNHDEVDKAIAEALDRWELKRVAQVDRAVLRIAATELLYVQDVPAKVAIDEAIEIAGRYGSNQSGAFVNGVLDRLARAHREL